MGKEGGKKSCREQRISFRDFNAKRYSKRKRGDVETIGKNERKGGEAARSKSSVRGQIPHQYGVWRVNE